MLTIRQAQLDALGADLHRRFLTRLRDHAWSGFDDKLAFMPTEDLDALLGAVMSRARDLNLIAARDIFMMVNLALIRLPEPDPASPRLDAQKAVRNLGFSEATYFATAPCHRFDFLRRVFEDQIAREEANARLR